MENMTTSKQQHANKFGAMECRNHSNAVTPKNHKSRINLLIMGALLFAFCAFTSKAVAQTWKVGSFIIDDVTATFTQDGTLTFSGVGDMQDFDTENNPAPWASLDVKTVIIEEGITNIGALAFYQCSTLTSIAIPNGVTTIGGWAFYQCSSLESLVIPTSVISLGGGACYSCTSLETLSIPASLDVNSHSGVGVTTAFAACTSLTSLTLTGGGDISYYSAYSVAPWGDTKIKTLIIEEGATSIGNNAFSRCLEMTDVSIPSTMLKIGCTAFGQANALTKVVMKASVPPQFGDELTECSTFGSSYTPNFFLIVPVGSKEAYEASVFETPYETSRLKDYCTIVEEGEPLFWQIGSPDAEDVTVFFDKDDYSAITLSGTGDTPDYYVNVDRSPWYHLKQYIEMITIEEGVTGIGNWAFETCPRLHSVVIPASMESIRECAFTNCNSLTSIVIPNGTIGQSAFYECASLMDVTLLQGVTHIGKTAFGNCYALTGVTIPESVTSIGETAFAYCRSLSTITIKNTAPPYVDPTAFAGVVEVNVRLIVPAGSSDAYKAADVWKYFRIEEEGMDWSFQNGRLTISGAGAIPDYMLTNPQLKSSSEVAETSAPWSMHQSEIVRILISEGITGIGNYSFYNCVNVETVELAGSVRKIGEYAFAQCGELKKIIAHSENGIFVDATAFNNVKTSDVTLAVPEGSAGNYSNNPVWSDFHVQEVSSIRNISNQSVSVYPNPVKDELFIISDNTINKVEIYTLTGRLLISENNFEGKISVSGLLQGAYLLRIYTDKGLLTSKIVKN